MWDEIREPLTDECFIPTNQGGKTVHMREPLEEEIAHVNPTYPFPKRPTRKENVPIEYPDGRQVLEIKEVPETDPAIIGKWEEEYRKTDEIRLLAIAEACIVPEDKPPGETPKERVEYLRKLPIMVRAKLMATAKNLNEKRLSEAYEQAKKD